VSAALESTAPPAPQARRRAGPEAPTQTLAGVGPKLAERLARLGIETRFARTLAILLRAGVPVVEAFDIVTAATGNDVYRRRLAPARDQLLAGDGITEPLAASGLFSPLLIQLVKVGEETGTLDRYLEQASDFMDSDLDYRTKQMVTIIEPMLIVGVAAMVGFVALSVVLPMYGILQSIR